MPATKEIMANNLNSPKFCHKLTAKKHKKHKIVTKKSFINLTTLFFGFKKFESKINPPHKSPDKNKKQKALNWLAVSKSII